MNLAGSKLPTSPQPKAVAIIPARFASSRLPGKALLEIAGKPMICWVAERAQAARNVARVIVATDDKRIFEAVRSAGHEAVLTHGNHASGTDRIAEVAATLDEAEIIVNVQGDEPLISPETIERAVEALAQSQSEEAGPAKTGTEESAGQAPGIVTTWERIDTADDVLNPDVVKIVVDNLGRALYFSRAPVPYPRDAVRRHGKIEVALKNEPGLVHRFRKHTGLYVYRKEVLLAFTKWPQTALEREESLEQLRALEHGVKIKAIEATACSIGVDTRAELERVRRIVSSSEFQVPGSI
ncbi:MAG: 3-deoxy-manno-octulosonate cytidylyltransferase [Pyrinomonadaceae bacterium]